MAKSADNKRLNKISEKKSEKCRKKHQTVLTYLLSLIIFRSLFEKRAVKTILPKIDQDKKPWHLIDAENQVVGQVAVRIADILRGKNKPIYTPHMDTGDFVVVVNAEKAVFTGKKESGKIYMKYTGWRGNEQRISAARLRERHPEQIIEKAVHGMVPKNRLGRSLMTKLKIYKGPEHPHKAQNPIPVSL
ncbi:MAG TPA: 50S ribosomal protein L13 [Verrucomicrobiales bacterium]|jgi:large subunit ribosomal protein L13|nr:50S ribosomal protein L13 [Verrucomicrobiales bacterium]